MADTDRAELRELCRHARRLRLQVLSAVDEHVAGQYARAVRGGGLDFHEFAPYQPGDDVRRMDWLVTARRGRPYVRRFRQEVLRRFIVCFDRSPSMSAPDPGGVPVRGLACSVAATLLLSAARTGDRAGALLFGEDVEHVAPRAGEKHAVAVLRRMLEPPRPAGRTDLGALLCAALNLRGGSILVLVSDFLTTPDIDDSAAGRLLRACAAKHTMLAVVLVHHSPAAPAGSVLEAVDPESGRTALLDAASPAARDGARRHAERVRSTLTRCGIACAVANPDEDGARIVARLFAARTASR